MIGERFRVVGIDMSIAHAAFVVLDEDGRLIDWRAIVKTKVLESSHAKSLPTELAKIDDRSLHSVARCAWICDRVIEFRQALACPDGLTFAAIEDYALHMARRAHQIGEIGGALRLLLYASRSWRVRFHDPSSVKLFATARGDAEKEDVAREAIAKWGDDVADLLAVDPRGDTGGDLVDAYVLARMALLEVRVRRGAIPLSGLRPEELRVFNRATKAEPVNVLDRPWVCREEVDRVREASNAKKARAQARRSEAAKPRRVKGDQ